MTKLAEAIDLGDHDALVECCRSWLQQKNVTLWQTFDLGETDDLEAASVWLADTLYAIDVYARYEYEWDVDENDDVEDRVRPTSADREDSDGDLWDAQLQWS